MRIKDITTERQMQDEWVDFGPIVTVTLEGRCNEINVGELVGEDVEIVLKKNIIDNILISMEEKAKKIALNSLYSLYGSQNVKKAQNSNKLLVKNIYYNKEKGVTVVIFEDGVKIIKRLAEGDVFDIRTAAALAIVERLYGSKTRFNKTIEKIAVDVKCKNKYKGE